MNAASPIKLQGLDAQSSTNESRLYLVSSPNPDVTEVDHSNDLESKDDAWADWFRELPRLSIQDDHRALIKNLSLNHSSLTRPFESISLYLPDTDPNVDLDESRNLRDTFVHDASIMVQHAYDSRHIANCFIRRAKNDHESMSIMRVLKLVYMAHGWTLAVLNRPLIMDRIEAWEYGPVIPTVYYAFRPQHVNDLSPFMMYERDIEPDIEELLEDVYRMYDDMSEPTLSRLTHVSGGPWARTYGGGNRYKEISDELIANHYKSILKRAQSGRRSA